MRLKFYEVDESYINYLKTFDRQVPTITYDRNNKFVCGIVLSIGEFNYFAPVSSFKVQQSTNILISDRDRILSSIRFCFMFPAPDEAIKLKDFQSEIQQYRDLLNAEIKFCNDNIIKILKTANKVYKIGSNRSHNLAYTCCDFKLLEQKCKEYSEQIRIVSQIQVAPASETVQEEVDREYRNKQP